jgi:pSer/pThr/pTyr-binding forkhead associated (FHA) protein
MQGAVDNPRPASAAELKSHIEAERTGVPFLVFRDPLGNQVIHLVGEADRVSVGRSSTDVALPWDDQVSRVHAELCRVAEDWVLADDGLSLNGTFLNGEFVGGRRRIHDGDVLRVGRTTLLFRNPSEADARTTNPITSPHRGVNLSDGQRRVLVALCRPFKSSTAFVTPATNEQIASELFLTVDAVKKQMRALFQKFGVESLPQNEKRARLVERAFAAGFVSERDL